VSARQAFKLWAKHGWLVAIPVALFLALV
jgi:hypothetical protein